MICSHCTESLDASTPMCTKCGEDPLLEGRFRLEKVVGRGAMGTTYRAIKVATGAVVAVKELLFHRLDSLKTQELFEREARVLRQLDHPAIPDYVDSFTIDSGRSTSLYLVQEFIDGTTLEAELAKRRYTDAEVLDVIEELIGIMDYIHGLRPPVIHRDIKPANVMRRSNGRLALIDFGSVRDAIKDAVVGGSTVAGTYGFMAPEQLMGRATPASDIFGIGMTAISLLTRSSPTELLGIDGNVRWSPQSGASAGVAALLNAMIHRDERQRPAGAKVRERIKDLRANPQAPPPKASASPPTKGASLVAVGAALVLMLGSVGAFFAIGATEDSERVTMTAPKFDEPVQFRVTAPVPISDPEPDPTPEPEPQPDPESFPPPRRAGPFELGMSVEEAQQAVPRLEHWKEDRYERYGDSIDLAPPYGRISEIVDIPGKHYTVRLLIADEPAACKLNFSLEERLSHLECKFDNPADLDLILSLFDRLKAEFEHSYGPPQIPRSTAPLNTHWEWGRNKASQLFLWHDANYKGEAHVQSPAGFILTDPRHEALMDRLKIEVQDALQEKAAQLQEQEAERLRARQELERERLR